MPFRMSSDDRIGVPDFQLYAVDTTPKVTAGTIIRAYDDTSILGDAEFIYMQASVTYTAGQVVCFRNGPGFANALASSTSHANSGRSLAVALQAMPAGAYGWFQLTGVATVSAAAAAADARVYLSTTPGQVSSAQVNGSQVQGVFASALGVPAAGFAYMQINRPHVQMQTT